MEFTIPCVGNYSDVVYAMKMVKGMLQSDTFLILFTTAILLGVIIPNLWRVGLFFSTGQIKISFSWLLGALFFAFLIAPATTVIVEDEDFGSASTGQFTVINRAPLAPALGAFFYSHSVKTFSKLAETHGSPIIEFGDIRSDLSYKLITELPGVYNVAKSVDPVMIKNIETYVDNCLLTAVNMGRISMNDLLRPGSENLWDKFYIDGNVYTTPYYVDTQNNSTAVNCSAAHGYIGSAYNINKNSIMEAYCTAYNIPVTGSICQVTFDKLTSGFFNKTGADFLINYLSATSVQNVAKEYIDLADKQTNVRNATVAIMAEKWLPKLQANMFIVVLLLTPVAMLLLPFSPGGVVKWYGGMYVWLILWACADQMLFLKYQNEIYELFKEMRSSGMGILQLLDVSSDMLTNVGLYGKMRFATMTLTLGMSMAILGIGNHAMANLAELMGSTAQQVSDNAGASLSQPGGTDASRDSMLREKSRGWAAHHSPDSAIANEVVYGYTSSISQSSALTGHMGGGDAITAGERVGSANAIGTAGSVTGTEMLSDIYGESGLISRTGEQQAFNFQNTEAYQSWVADKYGSRGEAAGAMGELNAQQQAIAKNIMDTKVAGYEGSFDSLSAETASNEMASFWQQTGQLSAAQNRADILFGGDLTRYTHFTANGNVVTEDNHSAIARTTGHNIPVGSQLDFAVTDKGVANIVGRQNVVTTDGSISSVATYYGSDGSVMQNISGANGGTSFSSVSYNGQTVSGNWNSGVSGNISVGSVNTSIGASAHLGNVAAQSALTGNLDSGAAGLMFGDNVNSALAQTLVNSQADAMAQYYSKSRSAGATVDAGAALKAFGNGGGFTANASDSEVMNTLRNEMQTKYESIQTNDLLTYDQKNTQWNNYTSELMDIYKHKNTDTKAEIVGGIVKDNVIDTTGDFLASRAAQSPDRVPVGVVDPITGTYTTDIPNKKK